MTTKNWFDVDKAGLAKLLEQRGKAFAVFELIQNAWDADGATDVGVTLDRIPGKPLARLTVADNAPSGFADLSHAFTLFAESQKKGDPEKRGRFNLGEKLVLALCTEAKVVSTQGCVFFDAHGRHSSRERTSAGSIFSAVIRMTVTESDEVARKIHSLIPPSGVTTTFNGAPLVQREHVVLFTAKLPTLIADEEGILRRVERETTVRIFDPGADGTGTIYELGIPVVETGDRYSVDVGQKVPLNLDRDNVPPAYARTLRTLVLNAVAHKLTESEAGEGWVTDALHHPDVASEAITEVLDKRYGEKRAIYDPSDVEANNRLVAEGYKLLHGGTFGRQAWENIRESQAALPSGEIRPTPKPYSDDPDAPPVDVIPEAKWTPEARRIVKFAVWLHAQLFPGPDLVVTLVRTNNGFAACYSKGRLDFNVKRLGWAWFVPDPTLDYVSRVVDLLVHEFAHWYSGNHLDEAYYNGLSRLAGLTCRLALLYPREFDWRN